jgi:hypothetical protein
VSPLLQIAAESDDRLLLADHDSGLLIVRSDAPSPGQGRLGWGVLGSTLPVRFPECLRVRDCSVTPFAIQPGQVLTPESCAVAMRVDGPRGSWVGVWRPAERRVHHLRAPEGWLAGTGLWTPEGVLRLPYATEAVPCGVARVSPPPAAVQEPGAASAPHQEQESPAPVPERSGPPPAEPGPPAPPTRPAEPATPSAPRPVPLQEAPLGRLVTNQCRLAWPPGSEVRGAG